MAQPEISSGVATIGTGDVVTTLVMLFIVLGLIVALGWIAKKMRIGLPKTQGNMQVLTQMSLGQKERLVVVKVGNENLLLAVTASQVSYIKTLPDDFEDLQESVVKQSD